MRSFRVATFNVENINRAGVFFAGRPKDAAYDAASIEAKASWIGGILDASRADIVGVQEVFSVEALELAASKSPYLVQSGPITVLAPGTEGRKNEKTNSDGRTEAEGPFVGLISRFPVLHVESIAAFPANVELRIPTGLHDDAGTVVTLPIAAFERSVLKARIAVKEGVEITVLVAHLKSKRAKYLPGEDIEDPVVMALGATRSLIVRAAEAVALRSIVSSIIRDKEPGARGEPLIVLGDLNDDVPTVTSQVVAGDEPPHYWSREQKQKLWDVLLYSVHDLQEAQSYRDVSYTHIFNGRYELLDHIFVSQEFVRQFPHRVAEVRNTRIFNDHIFDRRLAAPGEKASTALRLVSLGSDHGVPVTEFTFQNVAPAS